MAYLPERYKVRRKNLLNQVTDQLPAMVPGAPGMVLFMAGFDHYGSPVPFRQDKNFLYFVGLNEPGVMLASYTDGKEVLYIPHYPESKKQWVTGGIERTDDPGLYGVDEIRYLGDVINDYAWYPFKKKDRYHLLLKNLAAHAQAGGRFGMVLGKSLRGAPKENQDAAHVNNKQLGGPVNLDAVPFIDTPVMLWQWLFSWESALAEKVYDFSYEAHELRRTKDSYELAAMKRAIDGTLRAQKNVAAFLKSGLYEYEVRALVEYSFLQENLMTSFPTIVASGKNGTVLHYTDCTARIREKDLVVVDCGAEYEGYAADITRTHGIAGNMSPRQQELFSLVKAVQGYCASQARPGIYLKNMQHQDNSLHHRAIAYLEKEGYASYFTHGLGHYLGLNVHDVGDYGLPLRAGDVITIEPGLYIPDESIGIRIEDNFLITETGCQSLSY